MSRWRWAICLLGAWSCGGCRLAGPTAPPVSPLAVVPEGAIPLQPVAAADLPTNEELWRMSRNAAVVQAGRTAFNASSCRTCHAVKLTGGPGPNLVDQRWLHGGTPREVFRTITTGVQSKGMPVWGPVLGRRMISEIVAFIFSFHREGEPIEVQTSFTPTTPVYEY